jgi:hypothetical protein
MIYFNFHFGRIKDDIPGIADNFSIARENFFEALREIAIISNSLDLISYEFSTLYVWSKQEYNDEYDSNILNTFEIKFLSPWDLKIGSQIFDLRTI